MAQLISIPDTSGGDSSVNMGLLIPSIYYDHVNRASNIGDLNLSGTLTDTFISGKNITITGTVLFPDDNRICYMVCDVLNLNGVIDANYVAGTGGTVGDDIPNPPSAGKGLVIIARTITGTGTIKASGGPGLTTATTTLAGNGIAGKTMIFNSTTTGLVDVAQGALVESTGDAKGGITHASSVLRALFCPYWLKYTEPPNNLFQSGGGGSGSNSTGSTPTGGGGGGASIIGNGGNGGRATLAGSYFNGGGGGGGFVTIITPNALPAITINVAGGNGSNGKSNQHCGGGGGGGGLASLFAPSSTATIQVAGGTGGIGAGQNGDAGQNGTSYLTYFAG